MSKSMLANPKAALGFAGVTIAIAIAASFGADAFLPVSEQETKVVAETETVPEARAESAPATTVGWVDDGFSDDWNDSAVDTASGNGPSQDSDVPDELGQPEFDDFTPQTRTSSSTANRSPSARSAPTAGPRIQSGAAPGAPPVNPPGGGGSGKLEQVD